MCEVGDARVAQGLWPVLAGRAARHERDCAFGACVHKAAVEAVGRQDTNLVSCSCVSEGPPVTLPPLSPPVEPPGANSLMLRMSSGTSFHDVTMMLRAWGGWVMAVVCGTFA
jgi:hypothetical protein